MISQRDYALRLREVLVLCLNKKYQEAILFAQRLQKIKTPGNLHPMLDWALHEVGDVAYIYQNCLDGDLSMGVIAASEQLKNEIARVDRYLAGELEPTVYSFTLNAHHPVHSYSYLVWLDAAHIQVRGLLGPELGKQIKNLLDLMQPAGKSDQEKLANIKNKLPNRIGEFEIEAGATRWILRESVV